MYEPRTYRHWIKDNGLVSFNVTVKETDLQIQASKNLERETQKLVIKHRDELEGYIRNHPSFLTALVPLPSDADAPDIIRLMIESAQKAGVGPMAAVAGAISEVVGTELSTRSSEIIIENGGDIYLNTKEKKVVGIYAGKSPLTGKINLEVDGNDTPLGICTSSGTVGHSLSYGKADAVVTLSKSATLADAVATAIGNIIKRSEDIPEGIKLAENIEGIAGLLIIKDDNIGLWGKVRIC